MKLEELTIGQAKEIAAMFPRTPVAASHSLSVGTQVIIRTVTHYYTGRITAVTDADIVLEDAAWIPDTGRWSTALSSGSVNEAEPYCDPVIICRGSIVDMTIWRGQLPKVQK